MYKVEYLEPSDMFTQAEAKAFSENPAVQEMLDFCDKNNFIKQLFSGEPVKLSADKEAPLAVPMDKFSLAFDLKAIAELGKGDKDFYFLEHTKDFRRYPEKLLYVDKNGEQYSSDHYVTDDDKERLPLYDPKHMPLQIHPNRCSARTLDDKTPRGDWCTGEHIMINSLSKKNLFKQAAELEESISLLKKDARNHQLSFENAKIQSEYCQLYENFIDAVLDLKNKQPKTEIQTKDLHKDDQISPDNSANMDL